MVLCGYTKSRMYHNSKWETVQQLAACIIRANANEEGNGTHSVESFVDSQKLVISKFYLIMKL
jgi:hypothetical protein